MHLVRIGAIGGVEDMLRHYNVNPITLIKNVGLSVTLSRNPNTLVSMAKMAELIERAARECQDEFFGLNLGLRQNPGVLLDLLISASQEDTVEHALHQFADNLYLHTTAASITVRSLRNETRIELYYKVSTEYGMDHMYQLGVGQLANLVGALLTGQETKKISMCLCQGTDDKEQSPHTGGAFSLNLRSSFNGISFPKILSERSPDLNQDLLKIHVRDYLIQLDHNYPGNFLYQAKDVIGRLLPSGECSVEQVAAILGFQRRSFQRKLEQVGKTYGGILKDVRFELARQYLELGTLTVSEIALNLGYSDVAVFSRNFKRWSGKSPSQWRESTQLNRRTSLPD